MTSTNDYYRHTLYMSDRKPVCHQPQRLVGLTELLEMDDLADHQVPCWLCTTYIEEENKKIFQTSTKKPSDLQLLINFLTRSKPWEKELWDFAIDVAMIIVFVAVAVMLLYSTLKGS